MARMAKSRPRKPTLKPDSDLAHRLQLHGPKSLTDSELLALVGTLDLEKAQKLLELTGGLARLGSRLKDPTKIDDLDAEPQAQLRAVYELTVRLARARITRGSLLTRSSATAKYLQSRYAEPGQEIAGALFLDERNQLLGEKELFRGTRHRCLISPEPFLRAALLLDASALIAFHTHPSGGVVASVKDVAFTDRLTKACEVVGLRLVDHLILGEPGKWSSLRRASEH